MQPDYDKIHYISTIPALMKVQEGSFNVVVSGSIGAGNSATFTGNTGTQIQKGTIKMYIRQNPVPAGSFPGLVDYNSSTYLAAPPAGATNGEPFVWVGCSVAGDPFTQEIDALVSYFISPSGLSVSIYIFNNTGGTMSLTNTTFTFYYKVYAPTFLT